MGFSSLVASAIGILLLIITAYVLAGGTLSVANVVASAERDAVAQQEIRMRTSIEILSASRNTTTSSIEAEIENTGSETVGDFEHTDIYLLTDGVPVHNSFGTGSGTWSIVSIQPDGIHPGYLDPGETMTIVVFYSGSSPDWMQITTSTGVSDSVYL